MHVQIDKSGCFSGKNAGWAVFFGSKEAELLQKDWNEKIVKFGIFRVHPDQFLDEFGQERRCRSVLFQIPKSFFKTSKHFLKSPRAIFALVKVSAGCPENVQSLPRNRAVVEARLCGRWGRIVRSIQPHYTVDSGRSFLEGDGEGKNKNPRRCGSPGISSTVRCEDGF